MSRERGARKSVHPSVRRSLFTILGLILSIFFVPSIDPNFTISPRFTNFFPRFLHSRPLVGTSRTAARSHLSSWSFVDRSVEMRQEREGAGRSVTMESPGAFARAKLGKGEREVEKGRNLIKDFQNIV